MATSKSSSFIDSSLVEEGVIYPDLCLAEFRRAELYDFGLGGIGGGVADASSGGRGGNFRLTFFPSTAD